MNRLDDAVSRILRVKIRAGMFGAGRPSRRPYAGRTELLGSPEHRQLARQAVRESLVLLKNNGGLLPLERRQRVLVAGDGADNIPKQCGGWTVSWQGDGSTNEDFPGATSIWAGIRAAVEAGGGTATLSADGSFSGTPPDVAIVVFGEDPYAEFRGDRDHLAHSLARPSDLALLRRLRQAGVPVVSVLLSGRPLWVNPELNTSDAFVAAWLPGTEGGGVADVIFRNSDGSIDHGFSGTLPFSWPRTAVQTPLNRGDVGYDPLFPFGFGLGYSDRWDLRQLPEESGVSEAGEAQMAFFRRGPVVPWRLFLGDAMEPAVAATGARTTTKGSDNLVVTAVDRDAQEDARAVRWSGVRPAFVYLYEKGAVDLSREAGEGLRLAFDVLVETPPEGEVELSMECGPGCAGRIDVTAALSRLPAGEWRTVAVPLACFASAGADMSRIHVPFGIASSGALALRFAEVRLEPPAEGDLPCRE
jgi:beta-glucosidase